MWNRKASWLLLSLGMGLASCGDSSGGGGGGGGLGSSGFQLVQISVANGAVWEINREIEFKFSAAVLFSSVSLNTINIQSTFGAPATGTFFVKGFDTDGDGIQDLFDPTTIVFQPKCPTMEDLSDSGLQPGGVGYVITVIGTSSGASNTVRSMSGTPLQQTQVRNFQTPASNDPATAFIDTTLGPPVPVVRNVGTLVQEATYIEVGDDDTNRVYFEFDEATQTFSTNPIGFEAPLNLYADVASKVAVVIEFNQAVNPSSTNINSTRLRLEFQDSTGTWEPIDTLVQLIENCTLVGATVRMEPIGLLPESSMFRAVVLPGFQDLVGQTNLLAIDNFAVAPTRAVDFASLDPTDDESDEFLESFIFGGNDPDSFQDTEALFDSPEAIWGSDELVAAFDFDGTGGPGGDFDWVIRDQEIFFFDTTATTIVGGPGGIPTRTQNATGGVVDLRNLIIEEGGEIRVQGPNPMVINASGSVRIEGRIDLSGFNAKDVATLNTGNQAEIGAAGAAGGGKGGNASEVLNNSTPRGGRGQGPFGQADTGGQGGESGYAVSGMGKDARRPGGGGGGRFAADACVPTQAACDVDQDGDGISDPQAGPCTNATGLYASAGCPGEARSRGAETMQSPAAGGEPGLGPFLDGNGTNDFLGTMPVVDGTGALVGLIRGELNELWAGYGGGGGGDAIPANTFPHPNWSISTDEKGGGGGGGAGGLNIRALGRIIFGGSGEIFAKGGVGATGENTIFLDHVGGTGGSGSGGHVILESASLIDFTDEGSQVTAAPRDWIASVGARLKIGPEMNSPPMGVSHGGQGGPGLIQLHVPDPVTPPGIDPGATDIVVPLAATIAADPLDEVMSPSGIPMIPTFGARSRARSDWISIGGADQNPTGPEDLVQFLFMGLETAMGPDQGKVLASGGVVDELPALLGPEAITGNVNVLPDEVTLSIAGTSLDPLRFDINPISNDIYLRTPALLQNFILRLQDATNPFVAQDFNVTSATYDDNNIALFVTVESGVLGTLQDFIAAIAPNGVNYTLIPRFFRVVTGNVPDALPSTAFVRITFQATGDDGFGNPDENNILVDFTGDIDEFNSLAPGALQFFRFEVEFDLDAMGTGVTVDTEAVSLDFLRIPFRF